MIRRIMGIFNFWGQKKHDITVEEKRVVEPTHETSRSQAIPGQPKRTQPFLGKKRKKVDRKPDVAELERIKQKEKARQARRDAEGTGHKFDKDA